MLQCIFFSITDVHVRIASSKHFFGEQRKKNEWAGLFLHSPLYYSCLKPKWKWLSFQSVRSLSSSRRVKSCEKAQPFAALLFYLSALPACLHEAPVGIAGADAHSQYRRDHQCFLTFLYSVQILSGVSYAGEKGTFANVCWHLTSTSIPQENPL